MLAHGEATRDLPSRPHEFMGNLLLLIVGGNDTTRNSISGSLLALNEFPDQYRKLRDNPALVTGMVPEIIRWQTPVIHMRRTALQDTVVAGKTIRKGDKVAMWYISGNRDEEAIEQADDFIIDRAAPAPASVVRFRHPSLCRQPPRRDAADHPVGGNPQAGLPMIEVDGPPDRGYSNVLRSIGSLAGTHPGLTREHDHVDSILRLHRPSCACGSRNSLAAVDLATGRQHSYRSFDDRISRLAGSFRSPVASRAGDRVAVLAPNTTDTFEVQFACARIGAIFVPLNWRLANPELRAILADCTPAMLVYDAEFADRAPRTRARLRNPPHCLARSGVREHRL